ncbi:phage terminase large subunit family protein, partial [Candidatus Babeliales bacterium]|nr:phage terminase large subunit family protein [Candidatus Babeliales bacterium]
MNININKEAQKIAGIGLDKIEKKYPRLFMGLVHHRTTDGTQMTFSNKKWLTDIYKDNSRFMIFVKCSQVHMTEHALCAMYTFARQGKRGMYVIPSNEHRRTFVADRIDRMKDYSELYDQALKEGTRDGSDSNIYKTLFGVGWKFVGSNVRGDFYEFPCEVLFFDEYDLLNHENVIYAYDRVANCRYPIIWKFGNPTRDDYGIHAEWVESDQREWFVECHCGHEQVLDWHNHF